MISLWPDADGADRGERWDCVNYMLKGFPYTIHMIYNERGSFIDLFCFSEMGEMSALQTKL